MTNILALQVVAQKLRGFQLFNTPPRSTNRMVKPNEVPPAIREFFRFIEEMK